jgi:4-hydroxyphenylpyruvate dioxygenase
MSRPSSASADRCSISSTPGATGLGLRRRIRLARRTRSQAEGVGFYYLDHLTHNVIRGNMDKWWDFYRDLFNFKQIHFFDIEGKLTGLVSRAITSPCGRIRIPLNEDPPTTRARSRNTCEIQWRGHPAHRGRHRRHLRGTDWIADKGIKFMPGPPETYYDLSRDRVHGHDEPIDRMKKHGILIDGEGVVDGGRPRSCCRSSPRP